MVVVAEAADAGVFVFFGGVAFDGGDAAEVVG
jgi:hypothetical protein